MKSRYIQLLTACLLLFTASCEKFLDIVPEGEIKQKDLFKSASGVEDALYGVYAQMHQTSLYGQELAFNTLDVMAQYLDCNNNTLITELGKFNYQNSDVENLFENIWTKMYNNISNVNAIVNCELLKDESYPYNIYKGEALGLRAFMHFDLVRLYTDQITENPEAGGIPYATEFSLKIPAFQKAADNYKAIIADLLEAERLLKDEGEHTDETNFMTNRKIHFNLHAVRATLARVYLTMGNKDSAYYYADKVIQKSGCRLTEATEVDHDVAGVLSNNETIFGIYYAGFYSVVNPKLQQAVSFSSLDPRRDIKNFYENNDVRIGAYFDDKTASKLRLSKLTDIYEQQGIVSSRPADRVLGINLIRLPEMYYIAAEAQLDADPDNARTLFDEVLRHRVNLYETWPSDNLLPEDIDKERYREFIGEGQTFYNMKRRNLRINGVDGETTYEPSTAIYTVPIPNIEYSNRY